uniref:Uncharacterized protein n=1 Tax=Myotis myotis TaxID=51298 RepID=A0A7J7SRN2_MYOMY|nr:hypothetical protein mMyoMyo1_009300 [Myotis myotis]
MTPTTPLSPFFAALKATPLRELVCPKHKHAPVCTFAPKCESSRSPRNMNSQRIPSFCLPFHLPTFQHSRWNCALFGVTLALPCPSVLLAKLFPQPGMPRPFHLSICTFYFPHSKAIPFQEALPKPQDRWAESCLPHLDLPDCVTGVCVRHISISTSFLK